MTLKQQVKAILKEYPETRENDIDLTIEIWKKIMPHLAEVFEKLRNLLKKLPTQESCKRYRAYYQSKGMYLPLNREVLKRRRKLEDEWRKSLNYQPFQNYSNE